GVDGIGQKGAQQLLESHGNLAGIYAALEKDAEAFKGRTKNALLTGKANALLSQELATIDRKAKVPYTLNDLVIPPPESSSLTALFKSLEFYSLLTREETLEHKAETAAGVDLQICMTPDEVRAALPALEGTVAIAPIYDNRYVFGTLVGLALSSRPGHAV